MQIFNKNKKTITNKFRFTDILDMIHNNNKDLAMRELKKINNSYSKNILRAINANDLVRAISLINVSVRFETKENKVDTRNIYLTDKEIRDRADNLVLINGMNKNEAIALAYRRSVRLKSKMVINKEQDSIQKSGYILTDA